jgi:predicted RNase H-like HicB family nuclease
MRLTAIIEKEPDRGFSAEIVELPGCVTEGETLEELKANLRETAEGWVETVRERVRREGCETLEIAL